MGFHKRYINKHVIISTFKETGAKGVSDLYINSDAITDDLDSPICKYITKIMNRTESIEYKNHLINVYMMQLLEGLYPHK